MHLPNRVAEYFVGCVVVSDDGLRRRVAVGHDHFPDRFSVKCSDVAFPFNRFDLVQCQRVFGVFS